MTVPTNSTENQVSSPSNESSNNLESNMAKARKALEHERQMRQDLEQQLAQMKKEKEINARKPYKEEDDEPVSDDPYVDHRVLDKKLKKFESTLDQKIEEKAEQKARGMIAEERRNSYLKQNSDFSEIMSPELMEKFVQKHPGLAEGILSMPEGFERQKLVYENIKALGLHKKEEPKTNIQDKIDQNRRSPFQPGSMGNAPYGNRGDFSPTGKKSAYDQLIALKKRIGVS